MITHLQERLEKRQRIGNERQLKVNPLLVDFSSNDYLGLARSPILTSKVMREWSQGSCLQKLGSTGSRLLTGNSLYAQTLEGSIAHFHGYEDGLLFNCGYMANIGLLSTAAGCHDTIFFDSAVHASMHAGIRLSGAHAFPFRHNDLSHLEDRLKRKSPRGERFICVESIYSTDGSIAPLADICRLAGEYDAHLIVDEAHAVGVCGHGGRGLVAENKLTSHVFAQVVTFGKALGVHGAIVLGNALLRKSLVNFSSAAIYTTALPYYALAAIKCSYEYFPYLEKERQHLQQLIQMFSKRGLCGSVTHIQAILIKGNERTKEAANALAHQGFDVRPLLSPTVRRGHEVLRICLHSFNTAEEVHALFDNLKFGIF